jgi:hypothetical protein
MTLDKKNKYLKEFKSEYSHTSMNKKTILNNRRKMTLNTRSIDKMENTTDKYRNTQVKNYFGCKKCPYIGTQMCIDTQRACYNGQEVPVTLIEKGKEHNNGICTGRKKEIITYFKLMDRPDGIRLIRNRNIFRMQDLTNDLHSRLLEIKNSEGRLTDDEKDLLAAFHGLNVELNKRVDRALQQDEGSKINVQKLTPSAINDLIRDNEVIEVPNKD